ncbi:MAG: hypothetical protein SGPRY_009042 [Prymnesium sp.]
MSQSLDRIAQVVCRSETSSLQQHASTYNITFAICVSPWRVIKVDSMTAKSGTQESVHMVGHTYNELALDQSFNTLIQRMLQYTVYTISRMLALIWLFLDKYGIFEVVELPHLWDFSALVSPLMHDIGGYATSQFGEGMHEFRLKKDHEGVVRLHMRQSSKASG